MRTITADDIHRMLQDQLREGLQATAGKGKKQKLIISPGFKIMHTASGLTYTVDQVVAKGKKPVIIAHSGDGNLLEIEPNEFKNYKGL